MDRDFKWTLMPEPCHLNQASSSDEYYPAFAIGKLIKILLDQSPGYLNDIAFGIHSNVQYLYQHRLDGLFCTRNV